MKRTSRIFQELITWLNRCACINFFGMSAAELIRKMAELPPAERVIFEQLYRAMQNGERTSASDSVAPASWPDFGHRLRQIYGSKITSDSQRIIDEARGER